MKHRSMMNADGRERGIGALAGESSAAGARGELCYGSGTRIALSCIVAVFAAMIVASFQCGFFSVVRPFGLAPDLCIAFVAASGLLCGSRFGAVTGIAVGFFIDAMSVGGISPNIILYFLCGAAVGLFRVPEPRPFREIWRYLSAVSAAAAAKKTLEAFWVVLTASDLDFSKLLIDFFVIGVTCTIAFSILVYLPVAVVFSLCRRSMASRQRY